MKKRAALQIEQLEARETPDVSLGHAAAGPLPASSAKLLSPDQAVLGPAPTPTATAQLLATQSAVLAPSGAGRTEAILHRQLLESLFRDTQELDKLLANTAKPPSTGTGETPADSQRPALGDLHSGELASLGWKFLSNYVRKAIRNEEAKFGRLADHEDMLHQVYVEFRQQLDGNDQALANVLNKDSLERQILSKTARRVLDRTRYEQQRQQKMVEFIDQPAPINPAEQEWHDLQIDLSNGLSNLGPRERQMLELRRQGMTFEEIGAETGLVKQRVFEIYSSALERLQEVYSS